MGSLVHGWCEDCGTRIYQGPKDSAMRAFYPINFHIEDGKNCMIPKELMPKCHLNYENRIRDWQDDLPKYSGMGPKSDLVDVCGNPINAEAKDEEKVVEKE
jgi:hypothetical protein